MWEVGDEPEKMWEVGDEPEKMWEVGDGKGKWEVGDGCLCTYFSKGLHFYPNFSARFISKCRDLRTFDAKWNFSCSLRSQ